MANEDKVILDLSDDVQALLDQQGIDLYQELQQDQPSLRVVFERDPLAPAGSRDIVPVLYGVAAVISALTPTILAILRQITPPNRAKTWVVEEIETRQPDGTTTIHRRQIRSSDEQRPSLAAPETASSSPSLPQEAKEQ